MFIKEMQHVKKKSQAVQKGSAGNLSLTLAPVQPIPLPRGPRRWELRSSRAEICFGFQKIIFSILKLQVRKATSFLKLLSSAQIPFFS